MEHMTRDLAPAAAFCAVVEHRSLTRAAEALGLPKSTVSRWLSELEERRGVKLVDRSSRHMLPTNAGRAFHARAREGFAAIQAALGEASDATLSVGGTVRITATPDLGEAILGPILSRFVEAHSDARVEAILTHDVIDLVSERVDVAVRIGPIRDPSLIAKRVGSGGRCIVASPKYIARRGRPNRPEDLRNHDCLGLRATNGELRWDLVRGARRRRMILTPRLVANSMNVLRNWVLEGRGVSMLPRVMCAHELHRGRLVSLLRTYLPREESISVVYAPGRFMPARVRLFVDFITKDLAKALGDCTAALSGSSDRRCP